VVRLEDGGPWPVAELRPSSDLQVGAVTGVDRRRKEPQGRGQS